MENESKKYSHIAFISYKREDKKWAKWLQQKLESYRLPVALRKVHTELPERTRPVFRDTTDLNGGVLVEAIQKGLESSRHLIVICSPRAANSEWVCKEVDYFISLGKGNNIIPFIVEGEPHSSDPLKECFPKSLLNIDSNKEPVGININEMGSDAAFIKVVSRILGLEFDALWQRAKKAERRRREMILGILLGFIALLAGLIFALTVANRSIRKERDSMYVAQSKAVAEQARMQISKGEVLNSIMALLEVMPEDIDNPSRPYVPEAEAALRMALDSLHFNDGWLSHTIANGVTDSHWTHDGNQIVNISCISDSTTAISVFSSDTYLPLRSFTLPSGALMTHISKDDKLVALQTGDGGQLSVFSLEDGHLVANVDKLSEDVMTWVQKFENTELERFVMADKVKADFNLGFDPEIISFNTDSGLALIMHDQRFDSRRGMTVSTFTVLDTKKKEGLWSGSFPCGTSSSVVSLSPSGRYLAVSVFNENETLQIIDVNTGEKKLIKLPYWSVFLDFTITISWSPDSRFVFCESDMAASYVISTESFSFIRSFTDGEAKYISSNASGNKMLYNFLGNTVVLFKNSPVWNREAHIEQVNYSDTEFIQCTQATGKVVKLRYKPVAPDTCRLFPSFTLHKRYSPRREEELCYEISCDSLGWTYSNSGYYLEPLQILHQGRYLVVKEETDNYYERFYDTHYSILETSTGARVMEWANLYGKDVELLKLHDTLFAMNYLMHDKTDIYEYPSYSDLIKQCKAIVKGINFSDTARKMFFLK